MILEVEIEKQEIEAGGSNEAEFWNQFEIIVKTLKIFFKNLKRSISDHLVVVFYKFIQNLSVCLLILLKIDFFGDFWDWLLVIFVGLHGGL